MFNLSHRLANKFSQLHSNLKKEKNAELKAASPAIASGFKLQKGLAGANTDTEIKKPEPLILTNTSQNRAISTPPNSVVRSAVKTPQVKIAYKRNTGVADIDGLPYTNTEDVSLLAKLGYSVDKDYYLFLPMGEEREDLYSYVEKVAAVSKDVARCIDNGTAFSSEHLKDMDYEVPEGYEIKGDLVCPIEKKAELIKQAIYDNIVIENPKGSKKEFGKNYPIPVMTYPVDYGYLPGYMAQDDADLDFFKGSDASKGFHGSFDVWRPDVKGELETKFYTSANEEEKKAILEAFKKVIRGTPKEYDNAALLDAINSFKVKTAAADSVHTYKLLGEVQGVGLRKELHTLLDEMNHPGLAVNYPETGEVMALIPGNKKNVKTIFNTLKERLSNREEERLVYGKDYKIKSIPNNNEKFKKFEFTDKYLKNFIDSNPELTRLKAADKDRQFKYFQDRYRLTQNPKGNLAGKLPQKAIDQLKGVAPIYDYQIKQRAENKIKTAAADPAQTILITGHSGSGKSTLGKLLAEKLNLPLHRVDAQQSWDDLRANLEAAPDYERKALTPGTLENKKYIRDIRKIVRKSLGEIDGPAILEGTQVTTLPDKQLKKYMANILVGGDVNQSIAQRLERMSDKAAKKGINFSPEQIEKKKLESKLVAESWSPGMDKFNKLPGVLKYNHTEHKPEGLIDQLRVLMNKKANALVVSGIHGDEPAGDKAAQKLKDSVDVVSDINPSDKRRFEGKDINRHFDKPTEGKVQKTILDIIRKKKPSKVIALHEDDEVNKPYAYSSESLKDDTREALKEYRTASSAHGDKTEDGVISEGKNPPDGSLEKALDDRDIPRVTLETPSKSQNMNKRVETQLDIVKKLLGKKADLANTQPAMSGNSALQATHRPVNMQTSTSTLKQVTPVDHEAYDNAFRAGAKNFLTAQTADTIPFSAGKILKPIKGEVAKGIAGKINKGENTMQAMTTLGAGELAAQNADNPKDKNKERLQNYGLGLAVNAIGLYPPAAGAIYAGQTVNNLYDAANVYNKYLQENPPRQFAPIMTGQAPMRPEYNVSIPLRQPAPAPVDFRLTQPNVRDQQDNSNINIIAKQGEATHKLKSSNIRAVGYDKENKRVETQLDIVKKLLGKKADLANTQPAMSLNAPSITGTHSPINIQTSTQGQTTPVDNTAKNNALASAGKSFLTDQAVGTIPNALAGIANFTRGAASGLGSLTNKAMLGANKLEAGGHIAAGELSARNADDPRTAMTDRVMSYASSLLPLVTKNPIAGTASYLGNTLYDAANAANVYHKTMPSAPPSMGKVPEQKFNIPLRQPAPAPVDFRLTQPNVRDQQDNSNINIIAKQGENQLEKMASPFSRRLMSILNKSDQPTKNKIIQQLVDYSKKEGKKPKKEFLDKLLGYVNKHHNEWPVGWEMTPEDAAERFSPLTGVYRNYFEKPGDNSFLNMGFGRKKTNEEMAAGKLLNEIFNGSAPRNEYTIKDKSLLDRSMRRARNFENVANNVTAPVNLSEYDLDMMGRHKHAPYYLSLEKKDGNSNPAKDRNFATAKLKIKKLMRQGKGVKGLLAQYKIDEQPFEDLLFTPHLANRNNLNRQSIMDEYARMKDWIDPDRPGFSDEWLESKLYPGQNKEWAKNPLYETVVDASNINPSKGPIGVSQYYVPAKSEEAGAILAKNLPNAASGFMYKGGPPSALQAAKKLENYTRNDERMFFSGVPEISAGYMSKGNPEYAGYVRPAGFADIRKQIADSIRQYRATITDPIQNYYMNNTVDFVGASVPTKAKLKARRLKKESEYKLHWSKDVHNRITAGRPYPFSYLTGEAKELVDAIKNRDWDNFKEEIGDTTYAAQMLAAQATGLNHPMLADISKFEHREKNWKDMFKDKGGVYHPDHMRGGSNYAKPSKIIKAFASAGIKVNQREAERLANKYTGGKMEKEAALSRPGMVTNFPARAIPSPSVGDRIGSLLMGKNYIPSPIDGESMYDAMLRSGRNADMLEVSKNTFGNNPLFHRLGLNKGRLAPLLGVADYMTQGKLSSILSPINGGNTYQANKNIQEMLSNPSIMSQFKQASSNQPLLPGMKQWSNKQPFNYAEDAYKRGRIPKHVRDDIVSGRAAEEFRPKFKEMLESIERSRRKN